MTILLTTIRDKNEYPRSIDETPRHVADSPANGTTPIEHYVRKSRDLSRSCAVSDPESARADSQNVRQIGHKGMA